MRTILGIPKDAVSQTSNIIVKEIDSTKSLDELNWRASFSIGDHHSIKIYGFEYYIEQFLNYVSDKDLDNLLHDVRIRYHNSLNIVTISGKMTHGKTLSDYSDAVSKVIKNIQAPTIPRLDDISKNGYRHVEFSYCHAHYLEYDILVNRTHFIITADLHNWNKTVEDIIERLSNDVECKVYQIARTFHVYTERGILTAFEIKIPEDMLDIDTKLLDHKIEQMVLAFSHL